MTPRKIVDYRILDAAKSDQLEAKVVDLMFEGWEPVGGVAVLAQSHDYEHATGRLYQAMVRFES